MSDDHVCAFHRDMTGQCFICRSVDLRMRESLERDERRHQADELKRAEAKIEADRIARDTLIAKGVELEKEMKRWLDEYAKELNRRVDVENVLAMVAAGKREMLTREECRQLAKKLGVPPK